MNTGRIEGVNNQIKVIKRMAFGFHDLEYFALKVKQAFPGRPASN
jgi:transposase